MIDLAEIVYLTNMALCFFLGFHFCLWAWFAGRKPTGMYTHLTLLFFCLAFSGAIESYARWLRLNDPSGFEQMLHAPWWAFRDIPLMCVLTFFCCAVFRRFIYPYIQLSMKKGRPISRTEVGEWIEREFKCNGEEIVAYNGRLLRKIKNLPVFYGIDVKIVNDLINSSRVQKYEPGDVIIRQGDYERSVYVIISGSVRVTKDGTPICSLSRSGDIFGEIAAISEEGQRTATVRAEVCTTCLVIDNCNLEGGIEHVFVYRILSEVLADRLAKTTKRLSDCLKER